MLENTENYDYGNGGIDMGKVEGKEGEGILEKAVILCFKTGRFGNSRKVKQSEVTNLSAYDEFGEEKTVISREKKAKNLKLTKVLLDSKELEAITSHDTKTRNIILRRWCLPSYADDGYYFVTLALVPDVDAYLVEREGDRRGLVEAFIQAYQGLREQARDNPLYREKDYPSEEQVRATFTWTVRYVSFSTPGRLAEISQSLYQREAEGLKETWRQAKEEARQGLLEAWVVLVNHFVERLTYKPDGKPQTFKDTLTGNILEFIELFERRDPTDYAELRAVVDQARQLLAGVDPKRLRKDIPFRDRVRQEVEAIKRISDDMLIDRPVRQIDLDD